MRSPVIELFAGLMTCVTGLFSKCSGPQQRRIAVTGIVGLPKSGMFRFFLPKVACCVSSCFLKVHHQSLRLSQTHNFANRQEARIHRTASDMLLVTCKWRYCCRFWALQGLNGVPIGTLLVVLQQWLVVASVCRTFLVG